jgi:peptidoglycan/LPS O-acetylase OafA/YrhL
MKGWRSSSYRADIDGLRALSILGVVFFHLNPLLLPGGYVGVDVFFVISLITGLLINSLEYETFSFRSFYLRRIQRLFPALLTVLLSCFLWAWFFCSPFELANLGKHIAGASIFGANFLQLSEVGYFDRAAELKPMLHLWSLGVEEQFYIVWPLFLWMIWRPGFQKRLSTLGLIFLVFLVSFISCCCLMRVNPKADFNLPITRFWELLLGAFLTLDVIKALFSNLNPSSRTVFTCLGFICVLGSFFELQGGAAFPGPIALIPTLGAAVIIGLGPHTWCHRQILSSRILVGIGLISYPIYLWHWPILAFQRMGIPPVLITEKMRLFVLALSGLLAIGTYFFVERPMRTASRRHQKGFALVIGMLMIGVSGLCAFEFNGWPLRFPRELRGFFVFKPDFETDARRGICWKDDTDNRWQFPDICSVGLSSGLVVWGDSHAARVYPGLKEFLGHEVAQFTRDSCAPILHRQKPECMKGNDYVFTEIARLKPKKVILAAYWNWYPLRNHMEDLVQTLNEIRNLGIETITVLGPVPQWQADLPDVLFHLSSSQGFQRKIPERISFGVKSQVQDFDGFMKTALAHQPNVHYVSLWGLLCNSDGCLDRVGESSENLVSWDYGHLTTPAARWLAPRLLDHAAKCAW